MDHKEILGFHCPRFNELPTIPLYKDQVISYVEEVLKPLNLNPNEKLLTPTMLNNYVKQRVVTPPVGRRYTERHLAYLIVVCLFKQVYSLTEICEMIQIQRDLYSTEQAYNYFCVELEKALQFVFSARESIEPNSATTVTFETEVLRSAVMSVAHKLFIQKYLQDKREIVSVKEKNKKKLANTELILDEFLEQV
ncbi:MAG: DUF1836 domain-containing protein [Turicibacter sp.]|nr:DUF1836 domain-containing protein [Turicibacter sp.]